MEVLKEKEVKKNYKIACVRLGMDALEKYTGSHVDLFQPYILLTNYPHYVDVFAETFHERVTRGTTMTASHSSQHRISIINFGMGSPVAGLIIELLSFIHPKATLMLGLCGGLRQEYQLCDYFNPVAAIREEGTSDAFLPKRCPALSSFVIQRYVVDELERKQCTYHTGVMHTTNVRFWEYKEDFRRNLADERSQAIDMECATMFVVGFVYKVPVGALMLISDLPLKSGGLKTKKKSQKVFEECSDQHIRMGMNILQTMQADESKGLGYQF